MRLLLDTHIFLWFISGDVRLRNDMRDAIRDPGNDAYLSVVSLWEIITKHKLGKLPLPHPPEIYLPTQRKIHDPFISRDCLQVKLARVHRFLCNRWVEKAVMFHCWEMIFAEQNPVSHRRRRGSPRSQTAAQRHIC